MRKLLSLLSVLVLFALPTVAWAQAVPSVDPAAWGASPFALAAVVLFVTASLKRAADRAGRTLSVWLWWAVSLALGILGAWALNLLGYGATLGTLSYPWAVVLFGLVAGLSASGFRDLAKTVSDWFVRPRVVVTQPLTPTTDGPSVPQ